MLLHIFTFSHPFSPLSHLFSPFHTPFDLSSPFLTLSHLSYPFITLSHLFSLFLTPFHLFPPLSHLFSSFLTSSPSQLPAQSWWSHWLSRQWCCWLKAGPQSFLVDLRQRVGSVGHVHCSSEVDSVELNCCFLGKRSWTVSVLQPHHALVVLHSKRRRSP